MCWTYYTLILMSTFFKDLLWFFQNFLSSLCSVSRVSTESGLWYRNQRETVPAESAVETATLNHMEVYLDDMLVKSLRSTDHLQHLSEAFDCLWKYKVQLNHEKYIFGVASRKFLGYLVTQRVIEANPNQISTILRMKSLACVKEVQMLNDRLPRSFEPVSQPIYG